MKRILFITMISILAFSCDTDDDSGYNNNPVTGDAVQLANNATFGTILTDDVGNTLYFFANDAGEGSNCNGGCADAWPPFYSADLTVENGLDLNDFGTITRDDGSRQNTYKGFPLYAFANDVTPGDVNGDGSGGVWYVAKPDYAVMVVRSQLIGRTNTNETIELTIDGTPGTEPTTYMVDANGNTLYRFVNDNALQNNFTADDFSNDGIWPIFASNETSFPSLYNADDFATIQVNGRDQLTYKGHPLYKFGQDAVKGDNFGVGFPQPGIWYVLNNTTADAQEAVNTIQLANNETFGSILTNENGETLYFFANDAKATANCNGGCAETWPPFYVEEITWDEGLVGADFTTITRNDGTMQIAYKGYPLYLFANDVNPGDVNGDGAGNVWFVAKPDYAIMVAQQQLIGRDQVGNLIELLQDGTEGTGNTRYLTDDRGNTLYNFANDTQLTNNYTAEDFSNNGAWPIYASENTAIPSIYNPADFQVITVFGQPQLTFKGWPLYHFGQDAAKGDTFGTGFPQPGVWFVNNGSTQEAPDADTSVYNESNEVDLSDDFSNPEGPFMLSEGSNLISASQQGSPRDVDYITLTVPNGYVLSGLEVQGFDANTGNQAFIGLVNGTAFPNDQNSTGAADLLGGKTYGAQDINSNILPAIGNLNGAQGFSGSLPAGTYSVWLNQTGPNSEAVLNFVLSAQ